MSDEPVFNGTWDRDDPERATLPFVAAGNAATAGRGTRPVHDRSGPGRGRTVEPWGSRTLGSALAELFGGFVQSGGRRAALRRPRRARGVGEERLAKGAKIVGAVRVVEEIANGARTVAFA
jgi:predicted peroxiredoxin